MPKNIPQAHLQSGEHLPLDIFGNGFYSLSLFFFFPIYLLHWRLIALQFCSGFCYTLTWISHGCTCVPHPEPPSRLLPYPTSHGCPSAPALSALFYASNLDCWSISHMVIYMFQWYSLKSSHPHLLPQSPKVCSLYLLLFCCHRYDLSKFHIYVLVCCNGLYLSGLLHSV